MSAYYNEIDSYAARWLRNLIAAGELPAGDVDERSIEDIDPADLIGYTHAHFFAGIGGWAYALRLAGWPDDRPVWTGSCPCQPFSSAGHRQGAADRRHLWPAFYRLIAQCQPPTIFGEQVAGTLGREWFSAVRADLEECGYACGCADLAAASVGAPHIRQRLFWVADAGWWWNVEPEDRERQPSAPGYEPQLYEPREASASTDGLADATSPRQARPENTRANSSNAVQGTRRVESQRGVLS